MPIRRLGSATERGLVLLLVLGVLSVFIDVGLLLSGETRLDGLVRLTGGDPGSVYAVLFLLRGLAGLFCAVAFLLWLRRAYGNLPALGVPRLRFGPAWSIGAWFVPILNFFRPKQIVDDVWRGSDPSAPRAFEDGWTGRPVPALLHWWWALWLLSSLLGVLPSLLYGNDPDLIGSAGLILADDVLQLAPNVLAILVVRSLTTRQQQRIDGLPAATGWLPPAEARPAF